MAVASGLAEVLSKYYEVLEEFGEFFVVDWRRCRLQAREWATFGGGLEPSINCPLHLWGCKKKSLSVLSENGFMV